MGARTALASPLALSLAAHVAVIGLLAGAGWLVGTAPHRDEERVVPVRRAADLPPDAPRPAMFSDAPPGSAEDGPVETVSLDTADPRFRPYLLTVRQRIWERWSVPALPAGRPPRGSLVVEFTLTRSGRLSAADVREPSGDPALDRAALQAVARAVPFSPLPESIAGDALRVRARFTYD